MKIIFPLLVLLSGCASLTENQCKVANWYKIGLKDAEKGHEESRIEDHKKSCAKLKITPNPEQYKKGREVGLQEFCTESKGLSYGISRRDFPDICPEELRLNFEKGYKEGLNYAKEISRRKAEKRRRKNKS
tara:strand:+ start:158 stop:550 length:393 start_codon:yes stop_codon:yes gene_type:complete